MSRLTKLIEMNKDLALKLNSDCIYYSKQQYEYAVYYYLDHNAAIIGTAAVTNFDENRVSSYAYMIKYKYMKEYNMLSKIEHGIHCHNHIGISEPSPDDYEGAFIFENDMWEFAKASGTSIIFHNNQLTEYCAAGKIADAAPLHCLVQGIVSGEV